MRTIIVIIASVTFACPVLADNANPAVAAQCLAAKVKTFKVTLSKSSEATNRIVYVQATDSSDARKIAKDQNPGWQVELVSEQK